MCLLSQGNPATRTENRCSTLAGISREGQETRHVDSELRYWEGESQASTQVLLVATGVESYCKAFGDAQDFWVNCRSMVWPLEPWPTAKSTWVSIVWPSSCAVSVSVRLVCYELIGPCVHKGVQPLHSPWTCGKYPELTYTTAAAILRNPGRYIRIYVFEARWYVEEAQIVLALFLACTVQRQSPAQAEQHCENHLNHEASLGDLRVWVLPTTFQLSTYHSVLLMEELDLALTAKKPQGDNQLRVLSGVDHPLTNTPGSGEVSFLSTSSSRSISVRLAGICSSEPAAALLLQSTPDASRSRLGCWRTWTRVSAATLWIGRTSCWPRELHCLNTNPIGSCLSPHHSLDGWPLGISWAG